MSAGVKAAVAERVAKADVRVKLEMSAAEARALRTALRYFCDCWDGVLEKDEVLASAKLTLTKVRAVVGTDGEERERTGVLLPRLPGAGGG